MQTTRKIGMGCGTHVTMAGVLALCAGAAFAKPPAVLDRVGMDVPMVLVIKSVEQAERKLDMLSAKLGEMSGGEAPSLLDSDARAFLSLQGLDKSGSAALLMWPDFDAAEGKGDVDAAPADDMDDMGDMGMGGPDVMELGKNQKFVMLIPVKNFEQFANNLNSADAGGGLWSIKVDPPEDAFANDEPTEVFLRPGGDGYAAMSTNRELLASYKASAGNMKAQAALLGATGDRIAGMTDVMLVANVELLRDDILRGVEKMKEQAQQQAGMMGQPEQMEESLESMQRLVSNWANDGRVGIIGQGLDEQGLWFDAGTEFREGTPMAAMFAGKSAAARGLERLPDLPYMMAMSMDTSSPAMRNISKAMMDMQQGMPGMNQMFAMQDGTEYNAFLLGAPPAGAMGGLFSQTVGFMGVKDAQDMRGTLQGALASMNGKKQQGMTLNTKFKKDVKKVGGVSIDSYEIAMQMDEQDQNAQMMQMMQAMIMGPGPMKGFYAATEGGMLYTMAANEPLLAMAIESAKSGKGLGGSEVIRDMRAKLPENSSMEMYIGFKPIADMGLGFASMMMGPIEVEIPEDVPPIAIGASMGEGAMHGRVYVPMKVLDAVAQIGKAFQEMQGDAMFGGDEPMMNGDEEEGDAPKF